MNLDSNVFKGGLGHLRIKEMYWNFETSLGFKFRGNSRGYKKANIQWVMAAR